MAKCSLGPRFVNRPTSEAGRGPDFTKLFPLSRNPPTSARIAVQAKSTRPRLDQFLLGRHPDRFWCVCRFLSGRVGMGEAASRPGFVSRHDRWIDRAYSRRRTGRCGAMEARLGGAGHHDDRRLRAYLRASTDFHDGFHCRDSAWGDRRNCHTGDCRNQPRLGRPGRHVGANRTKLSV